jgi:hypothetical protein
LLAEDASAYLGIQPTDQSNGNYVDTTSNDALAINFTDSNNNIGDGIAGGEGNQYNCGNGDCVTEIADVFEICN